MRGGQKSKQHQASLLGQLMSATGRKLPVAVGPHEVGFAVAPQRKRVRLETAGRRLSRRLDVAWVAALSLARRPSAIGTTFPPMVKSSLGLHSASRFEAAMALSTHPALTLVIMHLIKDFRLSSYGALES